MMGKTVLTRFPLTSLPKQNTQPTSTEEGRNGARV